MSAVTETEAWSRYRTLWLPSWKHDVITQLRVDQFRCKMKFPWAR